ncbi:aldose epimerase family protein [Maritalea mediterranea]|uniref:Aldose 1-epimerase n=1 Tax=Maritalea mediterranea TaxID=2909667 RepID=A0ABS9E890_9HYPH|nr:aldose epimerase family protein [Maritalea mediterranea]MCF4098114.1 galactose mutarotase [Maritalea mediterranea]
MRSDSTSEKGQIETGQVSAFGRTPKGEQVRLVRISNGGSSASIMTWGASLQDFHRVECDYSLVLGSPDFDAYLGPMLYFGAIVGPVANRVANGQFLLDGHLVELDRNENGKTTLHGGSSGTGQRNWTLLACNATSCTLGVTHGDGVGGFPGNVDVRAHYALDETGRLTLDIDACTDKTTPLNFAHHSYWNLDGQADISRHHMQISASKYLPVDAELIPADVPARVQGTVFDYRLAKPISSPDHMALDHNFCIDGADGQVRHLCTVQARQFSLDVHSTEPGLQVFDATGMDTTPFKGHQGHPYGPHAGLALEPQKWPDSPNREAFPSSLVQPGETYHQRTQFRVTPLAQKA